jgi:hypothetical protein
MQTIGERLEEARKKKGASIREAAEATKVRGEYLQKFEINQFDIGLGDLYVRGFLRAYAVFLHLAPERILADYAALGHGEARPRQPSREVYGRMDLSIGSGDDGGDGAAAETAGSGSTGGGAARPGAGEGPGRGVHVPRSRSSEPLQTGINQALVFKGIIALAGIIVLLLVLWVVKSLMGGSSSPEASRAAAVVSAPVPQAEEKVAIVALNDIRIKVVRQSDGTELYQGPLAANEQREFENVPLYLTASALESVAIEYKGRTTRLADKGMKGHDRVAFGPFR